VSGLDVTRLALASFGFAALACLLLTVVCLAAGASINGLVLAGFGVLAVTAVLSVWAAVSP